MKILITGVTGFVGSHLAEYCLSLDQQVEVIGTCRWRSRRENIEHFEDAINLYECDLRDASSVKTLLADIQPERIFHLAAQQKMSSRMQSVGCGVRTNAKLNSRLEAMMRANLRFMPAFPLEVLLQVHPLVEMSHFLFVAVELQRGNPVGEGPRCDHALPGL